ncbi:methyltransferase family protein [Geothermobacter ehrlichii]|uniref:Methyltransferase family protein n=2 Tax=Geothermobacter ehrlichii TaxID=213224 RepID=A0A5D3WII3_9BACT|nr:methyltransferase family protein [Geothermobacter ehrlichii]
MALDKEVLCCPDCGGASDIIGPIPASIVFAGKTLSRPLPGGALCRCSRCHLGFRWPRLSKDRMDQLYSQGGSEVWSVGGDRRRDWREARHCLKRVLPVGARVLDVGCFDGGFLEPFVGDYRCYGIEIHPRARRRAEEKGVEIVGEEFSELVGQFDCITAIDVFEHVEFPGKFLRKCLASLTCGGVLLVSTGNIDSFTFRLMGSRYWYCNIAEHISFLSPRWVMQLSDDLGVQIEHMAFFAHDDVSIARGIKYTVANVVYWLFPSLIRRLRNMGLGAKDVRRFPALAEHPLPWVSWSKDHFLVILRKL